jgi:hypothetical protein
MAISARLRPDHFARLARLFALASVLSGCTPLIGAYSDEAYKNATSLKAETLALMDKSGESFVTHKSEVDAVTTRISAAYEYSAGLPSNQLSAQQWQILRNPDGNLYGAFVRRWQSSGRISPAYRTEKKIDIAEAFDYIICLEANKKESRPCSAARAATAERSAMRGAPR